MTDGYGFAPMPPAPEPQLDTGPPPPRALRPVVVLLILNLVLSAALTVTVLLARDTVIDFQLAHAHLRDPALRDDLRKTYLGAMWGRVIGNVVASVVYAFMVRALLRGRRWAYRRVILLGSLGVVALVYLQFTPYPWWVHAEQLAQAVVLAALLWFVLRPEVRGHFAKHLPGRTRRNRY
jgi:hypothetical protein